MTLAAFATWKCHFCKEERPDEKISVVSKPLMMGTRVVGQENRRYCNDREYCRKKADQWEQ